MSAEPVALPGIPSFLPKAFMDLRSEGLVAYLLNFATLTATFSNCALLNDLSGELMVT